MDTAGELSPFKIVWKLCESRFVGQNILQNAKAFQLHLHLVSLGGLMVNILSHCLPCMDADLTFEVLFSHLFVAHRASRTLMFIWAVVVLSLGTSYFSTCLLATNCALIHLIPSGVCFIHSSKVLLTRGCPSSFTTL